MLRCVAWLCFICLMAMNSKESGAAVPAFSSATNACIACRIWREKNVREWIQSIAPLYCVLGVIAAAFFIGRIRGTQDLAANAAYQPHSSFGFWLASVAGYLSELSYHAIRFTRGATVVLLAAMFALAAWLRNRAMLFGWFYFLIAITPVALHLTRQGYVILYVPYSGPGPLFRRAADLALPVIAIKRRNRRHTRVAEFATDGGNFAATALMTWIHATHWPEPWRITASPQWQLTGRMRRDYPTLKSGAKFLFVDDPSGNCKATT